MAVLSHPGLYLLCFRHVSNMILQSAAPRELHMNPLQASSIPERQA